MSLWSALGMGPEGDEPEDRDARPRADDGPSQPGGRATPAAPAIGLGSIWSAANAAAAAVRATASDVVRSVQETDWKNELAAFGAEVKHDAEMVTEKVTAEVGHTAHVLKEAVQQLPELAAPRPGSGGGGGGGAAAGGGGGAAGGPAAGAGLGASISKIGMSIISGAKGMVDQVTDLVEGELSPGKGGGAAARRAAGRASPGMPRVGSSSAKYSRFETEVAAMQRDSGTYCDEPPDAADYAAWREGFDFAGAEPRVAALLRGNVLVSELQARLVPLLVEREEFWTRYFYRLHKLQQREEQRQQLAARAKQQVSVEDEELGWDDEPNTPLSPESASAPGTAGSAPSAAAAAAGAAVAEPQPAGRAPDAAAEPTAALAAMSLSDAGDGAHQLSEAAVAAPPPVETPSAAALEPTAAAAPPAVPQPAAAQPAARGPAGGAAAAAATGRPLAAVAASVSSGLSTPVRVGSDGEDSAAAESLVQGDSASEGSAGPQRGWAIVTGARAKRSPVPEEPEASGSDGEGGGGGAAAAAHDAAAAAAAEGAGGGAAADDTEASWGDDEDGGDAGGSAPAAAVGAAGAGAAASKPAAGENDWSDDWE